MHPDSPFRTPPPLRCPVCPTEKLSAGALHHCTLCEGIWIDESTLSERVAGMRSDRPRHIEWEPMTSSERPCAACSEPMDALALYGVPVDRCVNHGVWFDRDELATVLERANAAPPTLETPVMSLVPVAVASPNTTGIDAGDALYVAADVVTSGFDIVDIAGTVGGAVVDVGGFLLEGALHVLGEIFSAIDL